MASPPADPNRVWIADFPVRHVLPFGRLGSNIQQVIAEREMEQGGQFAWIVGSNPNDQVLPGSPLFRLSGELIGVATTANTGDSIVAASSPSVTELVNHASPKAQPFPIDPKIVAMLAAAAQVRQRLPDADAPSYELALGVQRQLQHVAQFDGIPDSPDQYEALCGFATAMIELDEQIQMGEWSPEQVAEADAFLRDTLDQFADKLKLALDAGRLSEVSDINHWADESAKNGGGQAVFAEVARNGFLESDASPFVIFHLLNTDRHLFTVVKYDGPIFLPGSRWLLFGRPSPQLSYRVSDGISVIEAAVCDVKYVFPLD